MLNQSLMLKLYLLYGSKTFFHFYSEQCCFRWCFTLNRNLMATPSIELIQALRNAAKKIEASNQYQWGHMGLCNCGFLAQEITSRKKEEIHRRAMQGHGDWNEQLNDYCPTSGLLMDELISEMLAFGFDSDDLKHLERLSDSDVLRVLPLAERNLKQNIKADVVIYLNVWAKVLESKLIEQISLSEVEHSLMEV